MTLSYGQPQKNRVRSESLETAVKLLTTERDQSCAVPSNYVQDVRDYILGHKSTRPGDAAVAMQLSDETIKRWSSLQRSFVGTKKASELQVAYLCGPDPTLDFDVLVKLGVHPNNIWAFENDSNSYDNAIKKIKESKFSSVKIHKGSITQFFESIPKQFDIIYLDTCASILSTGQQVPLMISSVFEFQRLKSPGVLLTNCALPDFTNTAVSEAFDIFAASYLYPKNFLESDQSGGITDGAIAHGYDPDCSVANNPKPSFLTQIRSDRKRYYSELQTRVLFDLGVSLNPNRRMSKLKSVWKRFFLKDYSSALAESDVIQLFDKGGDIIADPGQYPISWAITSSTSKINDINYGNLSLNQKDGARKIFSQLTGPGYEASVAIDSLRINADLHSISFKEALGRFDDIFSHHQFCDLVLPNLAFDCLLAQYSYPMIPVVNKVSRWTYKAKETQMYVDLIPYDECRYIFDWLPTMDLIDHTFSQIEEDLCFRFALDGLCRQRKWYISEFLYGSAVLSKDIESFEAFRLAAREGI